MGWRDQVADSQRFQTAMQDDEQNAQMERAKLEAQTRVQTTGMTNATTLANTELQNKGALDQQGLKNQGALQNQGLQNQGMLDNTLAGRGSTNIVGGTERDPYASKIGTSGFGQSRLTGLGGIGSFGMANSGVIPGQINPNVADDTIINAKIGEFVLSVEDVQLLGGPEAIENMIIRLREEAGLPTEMGPKGHGEPDYLGRMDARGLSGSSGYSNNGYVRGQTAVFNPKDVQDDAKAIEQAKAEQSRNFAGKSFGVPTTGGVPQRSQFSQFADSFGAGAQAGAGHVRQPQQSQQQEERKVPPALPPDVSTKPNGYRKYSNGREVVRNGDGSFDDLDKSGNRMPMQQAQAYESNGDYIRRGIAEANSMMEKLERDKMEQTRGLHEAQTANYQVETKRKQQEVDTYDKALQGDKSALGVLGRSPKDDVLKVLLPYLKEGSRTPEEIDNMIGSVTTSLDRRDEALKEGKRWGIIRPGQEAKSPWYWKNTPAIPAQYGWTK